MDNTPSPQISPASTVDALWIPLACTGPPVVDTHDAPHFAQASALGVEENGGAVDKRKAQRVAWDAETDVTNLLSQPPLRVADEASAA